MFYKNISIVLVFLFFSVFGIFAQVSVTINDYGTYFIDNGVVKRIPTVIDNSGGYERKPILVPQAFWRNYIVFNVGSSSGNLLVLYNIENGVISDILHFEDYHTITAALKSSNRNLLFHVHGLEYEIDPVTLRTINKRVVNIRPKDSEIASDWYGHYYIDKSPDEHEQNSQETRYESLGDWNNRNTRYHGKNFYLDLTLNQNLGRQFVHVIGGKINQFALVVGVEYPYAH